MVDLVGIGIGWTPLVALLLRGILSVPWMVVAFLDQTRSR
ncbi:hypothetical protein NOZE110980_13100 [Nocardioides zeicaulis]